MPLETATPIIIPANKDTPVIQEIPVIEEEMPLIEVNVRPLPIVIADSPKVILCRKTGVVDFYHSHLFICL